MGDRPRPDQPDPLHCEVCLKEIPASEAKSAEVEDYVLYFCGLECYGRWSAQRDQQQESSR